MVLDNIFWARTWTIWPQNVMLCIFLWSANRMECSSFYGPPLEKVWEPLLWQLRVWTTLEGMWTNYFDVILQLEEARREEKLLIIKVQFQQKAFFLQNLGILYYVLIKRRDVGMRLKHHIFVISIRKILRKLFGKQISILIINKTI